MQPTVNNNSSQDDKKNISDVVFSDLSEYLFNKVNLLNNPGIVTSNGVTSTTTYNAAVRVPDTSAGKYIRHDKRSRLRTIFYIFGGAEFADAYILSPCFYPSTATISSGFTSMSIFNYYVGIKIYNGAVSLVAKDNNVERTILTSTTLVGSNTYKLEIIFNVTHADVYINNNYMGSISVDMRGAASTLTTIYPLIAPIRSTTGASVEMDLENYQFLQEK